MKIWEPKPPGTLWATPGLLRDTFTFTLHMSLTTNYLKQYKQNKQVEGIYTGLGIGLLARRPSNSGYMCMEHTNWSLRHTILSLHRRLQTGPAFQSTFFSKNSGRSCFAGKAISV